MTALTLAVRRSASPPPISGGPVEAPAGPRRSARRRRCSPPPISGGPVEARPPGPSRLPPKPRRRRSAADPLKPTVRAVLPERGLPARRRRSAADPLKRGARGCSLRSPRTRRRRSAADPLKPLVNEPAERTRDHSPPPISGGPVEAAEAGSCRWQPKPRRRRSAADPLKRRGRCGDSGR